MADGLPLTTVQKEFLVAVLSAIVEVGGPASVVEIRRHHGKSDSRVRSHIKVLLSRGYLFCVGKARVKRFVPSMDALELVYDRIYDDPKYDDLESLCVGGRCQKPGCRRVAEDFFRDGYYCRRCIIGHDDQTDLVDIRKQHELRWSTQSSASQALEMVNPTYDEDVGRDVSDMKEIELDTLKRK